MSRESRVDARDMSRDELIEFIQAGKAEGAILRGVDLSDAYLVGANFRNADLRGADLRGADLSEADLWGVCFDNAKMERADLSEADLSSASFVDSDLQYASLAYTRCKNTDFERVDLSYALLDEADLRGAYFADVLLTGATFFNVNLSNTTGLRAISVTVPNVRDSKLVGIVIDDEIRVFHGYRNGRPDTFRKAYSGDSPHHVTLRRALDFVESSLEG